MPYFIVNTRAQAASGDHEVHDNTPGTCNYLPNWENRKELGWHSSCVGAVKEAKKYYSDVNGCYWCANACHTG